MDMAQISLAIYKTQSCTPRVFTHNGKNIFDPNSKATDKQRCAIKRRYSVMEVSSPLFQLEAVSFIAPDGQDQR